MIIKKLSISPDETRKIASEFASLLNPGDLLFFTGELGGGKTTFISEAANALKTEENVSSPSFTLINIYRSRAFLKDTHIVHCDFYRTSSLQEIEDIGIEEYIYNEKNIVFIEWGSFFKEEIKKDYLEIKFEYFFEEKSIQENFMENSMRNITFISKSPYWDKKLEELKKCLSWQ